MRRWRNAVRPARAAGFLPRQSAEHGPHVFGIAVMQFVKDGEGLPPRGAGHLLVCGGAVHVAQPGQDGRPPALAGRWPMGA